MPGVLHGADVSDIVVEYGALVDGKRMSEIPFPGLFSEQRHMLVGERGGLHGVR